MTEDNHVIETNFYAIPVVGKQQFFPIDLGCDDQFHVNYNAQRVFKTRKVREEHQTHLHFHSSSIPLTVPNHPYNAPEESISIKNLPRHNQIKTTPRILHQYDWYKKNLLIHQSYGMKRSLDSLTWESVKWSYEKYTTEPSTHRLLPSRSDSIVYDKVEDAYSDIPIPVLHSYLDEACLDDHLSQQYWSVRNCIIRWKDNLLIYSSGPYCNELVLVKLIFLEDGLVDTKVFTTEDVHSRIFELQCHGDSLFVRTAYAVLYFTLIFEDNSYRFEKKKHMTFDQQIDAFAVNPSYLHEIMITTSQSSSIVSMKSGQIQQSISNNQLDNDSRDTNTNHLWQSLLYGSSVSTFLRSWECGVAMHDFRENTNISHVYLELPSEYLQRTEQLSPVLSWSPLNPYHQYTITTDQALLICDERYRKTPVMKIHHYMDTPPQFIQTRLSSTSPENCLLVIGSHKKSEIMSMTLRQGSVERMSISSKNDSSIKIRTPSQLDGQLTKFSSVDKWQYQIEDWKLGYENIFNRCSGQPCTGFIISECPGNELCLIQETQPCDLFYQKFSCGHLYQRESPKQLSKHEQKRCIAWLDATWNLLTIKSEKDDGKLFSHYDVMDVEEQLKQNESENEKMDLVNDQSDSPKPGSIFSEAIASNLSDTHFQNEQDSTKDASAGCGSSTLSHPSKNYNFNDSQDLIESPSSECNAEPPAKEKLYSDEIWEQLKELKTRKAFVTRSSLNLPPHFTTDIDNETMTSLFKPVTSSWEDYDKPIGKTLLKNWVDGSKAEYTFLEEFDPEINFEHLKEDALNMFGP